MDIDGLERLLVAIEFGSRPRQRARPDRAVAASAGGPDPRGHTHFSMTRRSRSGGRRRCSRGAGSRRSRHPELGHLDGEAIARVRAEAWPEATNADELHDALVWLGFLTEAEVGRRPGWSEWLRELARDRRVAMMETPAATLWIAAERMSDFRAVWPDAVLVPAIAAPGGLRRTPTSMPNARLVEIVRGRLEGLGPDDAGGPHPIPPGSRRSELLAALTALEVEGFALRGRFTPGTTEDEWCERRLLARIHQRTLNRLRAEIEPVAARDFIRFLLDWQRVTPERQMEGPAAVDAGRRPARRVRGGGERLGERDPACPSRRLRARLARRSLHGRQGRLDAAPAAGEPARGRAAAGSDRCGRRRSRCFPAAMRRYGPPSPREVPSRR